METPHLALGLSINMLLSRARSPESVTCLCRGQFVRMFSKCGFQVDTHRDHRFHQLPPISG